MLASRRLCSDQTLLDRNSTHLVNWSVLPIQILGHDLTPSVVGTIGTARAKVSLVSCFPPSCCRTHLRDSARANRNNGDQILRTGFKPGGAGGGKPRSSVLSARSNVGSGS